MEIILVWSQLAERQLRSIYDYYYVKASPSVAKKLTNRIVRKVSILEENPLIGQKEELLVDYTEDYRYLVEGNYKIVYWIQKQTITIAAIFDCRQNPVEMKNIT
ncbi:type II toxin-antitoxin system RelE/ParE family toxin [Cesiribacter andamanensis]|uniref:Plasmid stabilization system protein n=1 Tax=Cesiribacter andamanensis AMV16 TaxID=1279009 RepID=M7NUB4_9BACT|nr:type II toxin-antitoxin system RelE/ParE family toxin [Cesiribacter andamanensis]EMR02079.1 Plasmid stabilization system protein [Cesiribacter andamanensis AMV16]